MLATRTLEFRIVLDRPPALRAQQDVPSTDGSRKLCAPQETVVVTGTFAPQPATEIELDSRGHLYKNWVDEITTEPSLDLRQRAPNDIQADVSIRGSSFGQTLILVNGMRMDDAQSAHDDADLPLLCTQSIELKSSKVLAQLFMGRMRWPDP